MRRLVPVAAFAVVIGCAGVSTSQAAPGASEPARIVTLAPSLGELAADFLGERLDRIVGVSDYTDSPPALASKPSVGPYSHFNLEMVVALKPELVLATTDGNSKDQITHLRELGIRVLVVDTERFSQIETSMRQVGEALGHAEEGRAMAARFRSGLDKIRVMLAPGGVRPRVMLQIGDEPLVVVGQKSFLNEALEWIGAENVYGKSDARYPRPSREDVLAKNPSRLLVLALGRDLVSFKKMAQSWSAFPGLAAVRGKQVSVFQGDALLRPTPRLLEGLAQLKKAVHE